MVQCRTAQVREGVERFGGAGGDHGTPRHPLHQYVQVRRGQGPAGEGACYLREESWRPRARHRRRNLLSRLRCQHRGKKRLRRAGPAEGRGVAAAVARAEDAAAGRLAPGGRAGPEQAGRHLRGAEPVQRRRGLLQAGAGHPRGEARQAQLPRAADDQAPHFLLPNAGEERPRTRVLQACTRDMRVAPLRRRPSADRKRARPSRRHAHRNRPMEGGHGCTTTCAEHPKGEAGPQPQGHAGNDCYARPASPAAAAANGRASSSLRAARGGRPLRRQGCRLQAQAPRQAWPTAAAATAARRGTAEACGTRGARRVRRRPQRAA
mmetsp:Transcript_14865/g.58300  ORF Transcript_14865/g.58300 Transcript_14865/m.58300 type:complete len:321 (+) Transcript_14865:1638-2600(+)